VERRWCPPVFFPPAVVYSEYAEDRWMPVRWPKV
jgi:hypothetical protein